MTVILRRLQGQIGGVPLAQDARGWSALHVAARANLKHVIFDLCHDLEGKAAPGAAEALEARDFDEEARSPLEVALLHDGKEAASELLCAGAKAEVSPAAKKRISPKVRADAPRLCVS